MKKLLKILAVLALIVVGVMLFLKFKYSMDMPTGETGPKADALAQRMMDACNSEAWDQTRYVSWTFAGRNDYVWDRSTSKVRVTAGDCQTYLDTKTQKGRAYRNDIALEGPELTSELGSAWSNFCNDSFWLVAPMKVMDPGTTRELVSTDEGTGLMVHYSSGGVTPGDSYLWYVSEDGLPYAYRMWTQILPTQGVKATWENWETIHTGAKISTKHSLGPMDVMITNLKTGSTLEEIGLTSDFFE